MSLWNPGGDAVKMFPFPQKSKQIRWAVGASTGHVALTGILMPWASCKIPNLLLWSETTLISEYPKFTSGKREIITWTSHWTRCLGTNDLRDFSSFSDCKLIRNPQSLQFVLNIRFCLCNDELTVGLNNLKFHITVNYVRRCDVGHF